MLDKITPLILTYNEEANIGRVLEKLVWAREVVMLDSGSNDATCAIAQSFPNARIETRIFDSHASQWNYGITQTGINTEWVLALDADYVLEDDFIEEMLRLNPDLKTNGYRARFVYYLCGKPLSGSLYPPVVTLYRREKGHYMQDGHTQRLLLDGKIEELRGAIRHDDRKSLSRWLLSQDRYAQLECDFLLEHKWNELSWQDKIRKLIFIAPILVPFYCMTVGKGVLDGWRGLYYAIQRGVAEAILALKLLETAFSRDAR